MALRDNWKNKTNNDYVEADDINQIAEAVIRMEEDGVNEEQVQEAVENALKKAKESGEFDGAPGKDGEPYAFNFEVDEDGNLYCEYTGFDDAPDGQPFYYDEETGYLYYTPNDTFSYQVLNVNVIVDKVLGQISGGGASVYSVRTIDNEIGTQDLIVSDSTGATVLNMSFARNEENTATEMTVSNTYDQSVVITIKDGQDYVLTEEDKDEIADKVKNLISLADYVKTVNGQAPDENGNVVVTATMEMPGTAESIEWLEEKGDKSKPYVLKTTGTIWMYKYVDGEITKRKTYRRNDGFSKYSITSSGVTEKSGYIMTPSIKITDYNLPLTITLGGSAEWYIGAESGKNVLLSKKPPVITSDGEIIINNDYVPASDILYEHGVATAKSDTYIISEKGSEVCVLEFTKTNTIDEYGSDIDIYYNQCSYPSAADVYMTLEWKETIHDYAWYDTGLAFSGKNYDDVIESIQEDIKELKENKSEIDIPSFWQDAVNECIANIKNLQQGKNCVTFPFFSDNHQRNGYAGRLIAHIMKECHIPYCFYGGDSISSGTIADEATMIKQDKAFDDSMSYIPNGRFCRAVGNHDGYWYDGTNKHHYKRNNVYELFLREESVAQNKHYGDDGTYYYVDEIASKVRFIVLNTNAEEFSAGNEIIDENQVNWLKNKALSLDDEGWAVVIISHHPISNSYHADISNAADVISDIKTSGVDVIGWFSGHVHRDRMTTYLLTGGNDTTEGTPSSTKLGFTQVTITSDNTERAYKNDDGSTSSTYHEVAEDNQSHAIDFVTINRDTRTVNLTRLGIGDNRSFTY